MPLPDDADKNPNNIAYYIVTEIQHIPPVIQLFPLLGGILITQNKVIYEFIKSKYASLNIPCFYSRGKKHSHKLITQHKIRLVIYTGYQILFRGRAVQIFHGGLSDKNYVESIKILLYDMVLFPGEKTRDKIAKTGYLKYIPSWKLVGYPKFDPLINKSLTPATTFSNGRKTILYAPTWVSQNEKFRPIQTSTHGESSLMLWIKDIIRALHQDYNIIIKYHSRVYRKPNDIYEEVNNLITALSAEKTVVTKIDDNILPYMAEADLMISDMSTACYEWFHFDKPIVFANPSPEHYRRSDNISSNTYAWQAGDVINQPEDILPMVNQNLTNDSYRDVRNRIFNYTIYKPDGRATERQASAILEYAEKLKKNSYTIFTVTSWIIRRVRRASAKLLARYYRWFKKEEIRR
jgi:CDP-glycerol glycerophosphotransferase (TagB/SpsB family)